MYDIRVSLVFYRCVCVCVTIEWLDEKILIHFFSFFSKQIRYFVYGPWKPQKAL